MAEPIGKIGNGIKLRRECTVANFGRARGWYTAWQRTAARAAPEPEPRVCNFCGIWPEATGTEYWHRGSGLQLHC